MNHHQPWNFMPSTHAEIDAYCKIKNYRNTPKKLDLFVVRITKTGKIAESKPCMHCIKILGKTRLQIQNVYYSTNDEKIVCDTFYNLINCSSHHVTGGFIRKK